MKKGITICLLIAAIFALNAQSTIADKPEVVLVGGGTFTMGSNNNGESNQKPEHKVTLDSYSISKYPITVGQYKKYCIYSGKAMPYISSKAVNDQHPVIGINYDDAVSFCNWLGQQYGGVWSLPTEAQWEFAARGGNKSTNYIYSGSNDLDQVGWNSNQIERGITTREVGQKKANELGICDMSGNVWEWCKDWYGSYSADVQTNPKGAALGSERVLRGGGWDSRPVYCSVVFRNAIPPSGSLVDGGFRVVFSK